MSSTRKLNVISKKKIIISIIFDRIFEKKDSYSFLIIDGKMMFGIAGENALHSLHINMIFSKFGVFKTFKTNN